MKHTNRKLLQAIIALTATLQLTLASAQTESQQTLELAFKGFGGRSALQELNSLQVESTRDRYVFTAGGPTPGEGLFKLVASRLTGFYDFTGQKLRLNYVHKNLYQFERPVTELINGQSGFIIGGDDYYEKYANPDGTPDAEGMLPSRWAMTIKTERLLHPHFAFRELLDKAEIVISGDKAERGLRLAPEAVFPVSLSFDEVSGKRNLITNDQWLEQWEDTEFLNLLAKNVQVQNDWFDRWLDNNDSIQSTELSITLSDDVSPITYFIDPDSGHITRARTIEHDWAFGDVELEVRYLDWQAFDGVYFPTRIKMLVAGTPGLDITRSQISVNPALDTRTFSPPAEVEYRHDALAADRGARAAHWIQAQSHGGSPVKPIGEKQIKAMEIADGVYELLAIPNDDMRTLLVEQENSVVVVDPGFEDLKSEAILEWLELTIPGKPVSHIVITHHHVDHSGALRPFVAAGATVVAHALGETYYRDQLDRTYTVLPDALDRKPRGSNEKRVESVSENGFYRLDDAVRPVSVYPVVTGHSADMLLVFVEREGIVYNGDLYSHQHMPPNKAPQSCVDLNRAILENNLEVNLMSSSHSTLVSYETFTTYLSQ